MFITGCSVRLSQCYIVLIVIHTKCISTIRKSWPSFSPFRPCVQSPKHQSDFSEIWLWSVYSYNKVFLVILNSYVILWAICKGILRFLKKVHLKIMFISHKTQIWVRFTKNVWKISWQVAYLKKHEGKWPSRIAIVVMFQPYIREVLGSNLYRYISCHDWGSSWSFSFSPQASHSFCRQIQRWYLIRPRTLLSTLFPICYSPTILTFDTSQSEILRTDSFSVQCDVYSPSEAAMK
jgi:hypothetical protein